MTPDEIRATVNRIDTTSTSDSEAAWAQLRDLDEAVVPYLAESYRTFRKAQGRVSLVFHSIRYARTREDAYRLGILALSDKSALVRYRACMLLAYSLRREAVPHLQVLLSHSDARTVEDARAAIDAISSQNHNYFIDRTHTGRSFWNVS